ncbi:MAG: B12-binding domain-containing radical SAM protein, partial [Candidatus Hodarchaeales archaeon]
MQMQKRNGKIVLFLPPTKEDRIPVYQKTPLEILSIAGILLEKGYDVKPIDAFIREKYIDEVMSACEGALCLGISCLFGYQVYAAAAAAKLVKEKFPKLPVVLGGWFPTVKPDLFLNEGLADVVVRGQGEITFLQLVETFKYGNSFEDIKGITFKKDGKILNNPDRPFVSLNDLPPMPYHLIAKDMEKYIKSDQDCKLIRNLLADSKDSKWMDSELRILWYYSSYGCPNNCKFCCSPGVTRRRWLPKDPVKVVNEVEELVKKHSYNILYILDANFCVNETRIKRFCEEIIKRGIKLKWFAPAEVQSIDHFKKETLDLMAQSGCFSLLLGAETACAETMILLRKNIKSGQTERSVARLVSRGIMPEVSYVIGFPDETPESINQTIDECIRIKVKDPEIYTAIRWFLPLPG